MAASRSQCSASLHSICSPTWKGRRSHPNLASIANTLFIDQHPRCWLIVHALPLDQRRHFRAVPFGGTPLAGDLPALRVDQQRRQHTRNSEAVRYSARRIDIDRELFDPDLLIEALDRRDALAIDRQRDDMEIIAAKLCL